MKIAVYGDSFATCRNSLETSWFKLLGKKLNCTVDSYGFPGTPVYYSYKKFMDTHKDYDRIIFLVTEPSRYHSKVEFTTGDTVYVSGITDIEWFKKLSILGSSDRELLTDIETWYKVSNFEYAVDMTELMLEKIESVRNDVVFAPCFPTSFSDIWHLKEPNTMPLVELVFRQVNLLWEKPNLTFDLLAHENHNVMSAHLAPEFNEFIATVMYDRLMTGTWDFSDYKNVALKHTHDYYYRNNQEAK